MAQDPRDESVVVSSLAYEQLVKEVTLSVVVSGNLSGGESRLWASDWVEMAQAGSTVRAEVLIPGNVYIFNSVFLLEAIADARFRVPVQMIYDNVNSISVVPRIEVSQNRYRCVVGVFNVNDFVIASPNRTFTFYAKEYVTPKS